VPATTPERVRLGSVRRARQAEVRDLRPLLRTALDEDVGGLDVAVDEPLLVRGRQPLRDLPADAHDLGHVQRPLAVEPGLERLARDELHDQVRQSLIVATHLVDAYDGLVLDPGRGLGLAREPFPGRRGRGHRRRQHLDGDHTL
jgi:hypothetical protein